MEHGSVVLLGKALSWETSAYTAVQVMAKFYQREERCSYQGNIPNSFNKGLSESGQQNLTLKIDCKCCIQFI